MEPMRQRMLQEYPAHCLPRGAEQDESFVRLRRAWKSEVRVTTPGRSDQMAAKEVGRGFSVMGGTRT